MSYYECHLERYVVRPVDRPHSRMLRRVSRPKRGLRSLTVDLSCKVVAEHAGRLHPDVVVNSEDRISARLTFLKFEMSLREKTMEVIPRDILSGKQCANTRSNLPTHIRLERFLILVMFKLRGGSGRMLLGKWRLRSDFDRSTACFDSSSHRIGPGVCAQPCFASRKRTAAYTE